MPNNKIYIGGTWEEGLGAPLTSINPSTNQAVWSGASAGFSQIDQAVQSAKEAFVVWRSVPLNERIEFLNHFKEQIEAHKSRCIEVLAAETGKPLWECSNEVASVLAKFAISFEAQKERCPVKEMAQSQATLVTRHKPHGVVAVLGPFNFPMHLPHGHIIPALLAGNTIVFKPSELTPAVASLYTEILHACNFPPGVFNLIQGAAQTGAYLTENPAVNGIFFTGSWKTGSRLMAANAKFPGRILALEMGGNNPLIVWDIARPNDAAYLTLQSAFITAGQRCSCARRLIISKGREGDVFLEAFIELVKDIRVGPPHATPEPFMGPVICAHAAQEIVKSYHELIQNGGNPLLPLKRLPDGPAFLSPGIIDITECSTLPDEEIFGPLLQVIRVETFDKALDAANDTSYGLCAGLLCDDASYYRQFWQTVRAGVINWNTPLTGASSAAPFGGVGKSGNFHPGAYYAADYCSYPVASMEAPQLIRRQPHPGTKDS